jgi:hypothetical protein
MGNLENYFLMIGFIVDLIVTPYQFAAFFMSLRLYLNQSRIAPFNKNLMMTFKVPKATFKVQKITFTKFGHFEGKKFFVDFLLLY